MLSDGGHPDPRDDLVLELAIESNADYLVRHNIRDFVGSDQFGVRIVSPRDFLGILRRSGKEETR